MKKKDLIKENIFLRKSIIENNKKLDIILEILEKKGNGIDARRDQKR